jgi:hypothetical protein
VAVSSNPGGYITERQLSDAQICVGFPKITMALLIYSTQNHCRNLTWTEKCSWYFSNSQCLPNFNVPTNFINYCAYRLKALSLL